MDAHIYSSKLDSSTSEILWNPNFSCRISGWEFTFSNFMFTPVLFHSSWNPVVTDIEVLGFPKRETKRKPQRNFHINFIKCLLTREAAQRKLAPLNWLRLALLGCFYRLGTKQACAKKEGFWKWQMFSFQGQWLPFLAALPSNYVPTCAVRTRYQADYYYHPPKAALWSSHGQCACNLSRQLERNKISFLCVFEQGVEGCLHFCGQFIPSSFWPPALNLVSYPPCIFYSWVKIPRLSHIGQFPFFP